MSGKRPRPLAAPLKACQTAPRKIRVRFLALQPRHPPVSVADLARMLEIDLLLGLRGDFMKRLQKALDAAATPPAKHQDRHQGRILNC